MRNNNGWRWFLGIILVGVILPGIGYAVHTANGASAEAKAARQDAAVLGEAVFGLRRELKQFRAAYSAAENRAREERTQIRDSLERLRWR